GLEEAEGIDRLQRRDGAGEGADETDDRQRAQPYRFGGLGEEARAEWAAEEPECRLGEKDDVLTEGADEAPHRRGRAGEGPPDALHDRAWRWGGGDLGGLGHQSPPTRTCRGTRFEMPQVISYSMRPAPAASSAAVMRSAPWLPMRTTSSPRETSSPSAVTSTISMSMQTEPTIGQRRPRMRTSAGRAATGAPRRRG